MTPAGRASVMSKPAAASGGNFALSASANGGCIYSYSEVSYAAAILGSGLTVETAAYLNLGQTFNSDETAFWLLCLLFVEFNVSSISGTVSSATLAFDVQADSSETDFIAEARTRDYGASLTTADWITSGAALAALTLLTSLNTSGMPGSGYADFTESGSALRDAVTAAKAGSGLLRMVICSSRQRGLNEPSGNELISLRGPSATNKPRLTVVTT